jgi:hypothetical protein
MTGLAALLRVLGDWRAYAAALVLGLAVSAWVFSVERDRAEVQASAAQADAADLRDKLAVSEDGRRGAITARDQAEARLADYALKSAEAWREQAAASSRMATQLTETNRRLRAAQEEIARANPGLRLDDPLPGGVRDSIACAGTTQDCDHATAADSGSVSSGASDAAGATGRPSGDPDRA